MLNDALPVALFIVISCERITEYFLVMAFKFVEEIQTAWDEKLTGGAKSILTALVNAGLYWLLFRVDFVSPILAEIDITIAPWQGLVFCTLLVAGGSNMVHEFFSYFRNGR